MKRVLIQAKKVADIREQRKLRERREARRELQCNEAAVASSEKLRDRQVKEREEAELFFSNEPGNEQAKIWHTVVSEKQEAAEQAHLKALENCDVAKLHAAQAVQEHQRACQRVEIFEAELVKERLARVRQEEERAIEEMAGKS